MGISTVAGGNVVAVGRAVHQRLDELKGRHPVGMELHVISYQSDTVTGAVNGFLSERAPFVALRVGPATLLAVPAEPASALGTRLRERGGDVPFVIAHANDWLGYAVTPDDYRHGGYEACLSFFGPGFGPWLVEQAEATLAVLDGAP